MMKANYKQLTCSILTALLVTVPLAGQAAPAIEKPGVQTNINETDNEADIKNTDTPKAENNQAQTFAIGKINIKSDEIKLKDYSKILKEYENRQISFAELNELSRRLTQDLRSNGYPAATIYISPQNIRQGGELTLAVEPGRYGEISIDNQSNLKDKTAEGYLAGLKKGEIIRTVELETAMHKLTTVGGIQVAGILSAGKEIGTTDLTVNIKKGKAATEILYAENYGTISAGRYRYGLQGDVQFSEIAGTLNYALVLSNGGQHNYNLGYSQNVGRSATKLGLNISRGDYELGGIYSVLGAKGNAFTVNLNATTPLFYSWKDSANLSYGYNYRNLKDEQSNFNLNMKKHSHSAYVGVNGIVRRGKAIFTYDVTDTLGTLGFDNDDARLIYSGANTEGTFNKINFNASYLQTFDKHFDMLVKYTGQIANKNLDGSEEIVLGGINGVRAYPTSFGSGDEGYVANLEFRYHTDIPGLTLSTYLDTGHVMVTHDSNSLSYGGETATGWGIGITYTKPDCYFARLDYARRIGGPRYYKTDKDALDKGRIWFMIGAIF